MKKIFTLFAVCFFAITHAPGLLAGEPDLKGQMSAGTAFWITFNQNYDLNEGVVASLELIITATEDNTSGVVNAPGTGFSEPFDISTANASVTISLPLELMCEEAGYAAKGVEVTSDKEVTLRGMNRSSFSTDAFLAIPAAYLGIEYKVLTYKSTTEGVNYSSHFTVVSPFDNNTVTITPSQNTSLGQPAGVPFEVTLDKGETYMVKSNGAIGSDMTGSVVKSDLAVAVFSGVGSTNIPQGTGFKDHIAMQVAPVIAWGQEFIGVPLATRANGQTWRFLASEDNTFLQINGANYPTFNENEFFEIVLDEPTHVLSNNPVLAVQFSHGQNWDNQTGDPFMMYVPPVIQYIHDYKFVMPEGFTSQHINVVAPTAAINSLLLDGISIAGAFSQLGGTSWSTASIDIDSPGFHQLVSTSETKFSVQSYGFGEDVSYGFPAVAGNEFINTESAVNLQIFDITQNSFTATWTRGTGDNVAVFLFKGDSEFAQPTDNVSYAPSTVFGEGNEIGNTGWHCVYNGSESTVSVTGLDLNTTYRIMAIEYYGTPGTEQYVLGNDLNNPVNFTTVDDLPFGLSYSPGIVEVIVETDHVFSTPHYSGGAIDNFSITPDLPQGMTINLATGVISGTPAEVLEPTIFTVTGSNSAGSAESAFYLTVNNIPPSLLTYDVSQVKTFINHTQVLLMPSVEGVVDGFSVSPALPQGLMINPLTGEISGVPVQVSDTTLYTVTAYNNGGNTQTQFEMWVQEFDPIILQVEDLNYTERTSPVVLFPNIEFLEGNSYINGYIRLEIENANDHESFGFEPVAQTTEEGSVSVQGNEVFAGIGEGDKAIIGVIDPVENGLNGNPLKINLAYERSFVNPGFENGQDNWEIGSGQYAALSDLDGLEIPFMPGDGCDGQTHGLIRIDPNPQDLVLEADTTSEDAAAEGEVSLRVTTSGRVPEVLGSDCRGDGYSVFGPTVTSGEFFANSGDLFAFNWKAATDEDYFDVFAWLVKPGVDNTWNTSDDERLMILSNRGSDTEWVTTQFEIPASGFYKLEFVAGAYDITGGGVVGATFWIDNVVITGNITSVDDLSLQKLARLINYQHTSCNPETERNLHLAILNNTENQAQETVQINIARVNCPPMLSVLPADLYYEINDGQAEDFGRLFFDAEIDYPESGQRIAEFSLLIENLNGLDDEYILIDNTQIPLDGPQNGTTEGSLANYNVTILGNDALVNVNANPSWGSETFLSIIENIRYKNTTEDPVDDTYRDISLVYLRDNGGLNNGGQDETHLAGMVAHVHLNKESLVAISVLDEFGNPFENVTITGTDTTMLSNSNGQALPDMQDGDHPFTFSVDGYDTISDTLKVRENKGWLEVTMSKFYPLTVTITGMGQAPIENAQVLLINHTTSDSTYLTTDAQGMVSQMLLNGNYSFEATSEGYLPESQEFAIDGEGVNLTQALIPVHPLTITLMDPQGNLTEGVSLEINNIELVTDSFGTATIELVDGNYQLHITDENYQEMITGVTISGGPESITLQITPIYLAQINAIGQSGENISPLTLEMNESIYTSNETGTIQIRMPAGVYNGILDAENYLAKHIQFIINDQNQKVEVILEPLYDIHFLFSNEEEELLTDVEVMIGDELLLSNEEGWTYLQLPAGTYNVNASKDGYIDHSSMLELGAHVTDTLTLDHIFFMASATTVNGDPVSEAVITAGENVFQTNENGFAKIILDNGEYDLMVEAPGFESHSGSLLVENWVAELDVVLEKRIAELPWTEDFESGVFPPAGWKITSHTNTAWEMNATENMTLEGNTSAWHKYGLTDQPDDGWLITPAIELPAGKTYKLSFHSLNQWVEYYGANSVLIATGENYPVPADFQPLWTTESVYDQWWENRVLLDDYAGQVIYLAFRYQGTFAHSWFLDQVSLQEHTGVFALNLNVNPGYTGFTEGAGEYEPGTQVEIKATPATGFEFVNWTDEQGNEISAEEEFIYTMPSEFVNLIAVFQMQLAEPQLYTLQVNTSHEGAGTTEGSGTYLEGEEIDLSVNPADGFPFMNWTDANGVMLSENLSFSFVMPARDVVVTANFDMASNTTNISQPTDELVVYPNPARERVTIKAPESTEGLMIFDITGNLIVRTDQVQDPTYILDVSGWQSGFYIVKTQSDRGTLVTRFQIIR